MQVESTGAEGPGDMPTVHAGPESRRRSIEVTKERVVEIISSYLMEQSQANQHGTPYVSDQGNGMVFIDGDIDLGEIAERIIAG